MKRDSVDYVDEFFFFLVENFINTHARFEVLPNNGLDMWLEGASALVLLPPFREPKKLRKKDVDEANHIPETETTKLKKLGVQVMCQLYKGVGHNNMTCKEKNNPNFIKPVKIPIRKIIF